MIAVVTGGSGFIGQNLVRRLLRDGHEVRCLVRPYGGAAPQGAKRFVVRFEEPRSLMECEALDGAAVVFHLAAATKAPSAAAFAAANTAPARLLLGAISARRLYPRFVFVSSQAAAGPAPDRLHPIDEDDIPRPVEDYGRSKLEAERIVESFSERVPTTVIRPCAVFGPFDRDFFRLFRLAERGILLYPATANHWLSLLHVDDVVSGMLTAGQSDAAISRRYFLSSSEPTQWRALGDHIAAACGTPVRHVNVHPTLVRGASAAGDIVGRLTGSMPLANNSKAALARQPYWICSGARARAELAFSESRSLPDAVRDTYYWYRQSGWLRGSRGAGATVA